MSIRSDQVNHKSSLLNAGSHPALGGCFGPGCKVAYGESLAMDLIITIP